MIVTALLLGLVIVPTVRGGDGGERPLLGPATENQIAALVRDLSNPSYDKRTFATRRLCAIGMPAAEALRKTVQGDDAESALRAKAVLDVLDGVMFAGVEVRLAFSKSRISWDEAADLSVTMVNRSKYPARLPFELDPARRQAVTEDARQVGDMLDLADYLRIRSPGGRKIELTVDDISSDPAVVAAVQQRLNGGPGSALGAGEEVTLTARAFNRGWARYMLLDDGAYTVVMEYVPEWEDGVLAAERVGRVVSNETTITVSTAAPQSVSRSGAEAALVVEREGSFLVASLTNQTDQVVLVNKNFGPSPPFAEGRWVWQLDGNSRDLPLVPKPNASWHDFDAALLVEVAPGKPIELARIELADMRRVLTQVGADVNDPRWTVHFAYMNLCNRAWQARQGSTLLGNEKAPAIFRTPLPRRILSAQCTSNPLTVPAAD